MTGVAWRSRAEDGDTKRLLRLLEHSHDGFDTLHTEAALRVTDVQLQNAYVQQSSTRRGGQCITYRILPRPELAAEVTLARQVERRRQPIVRLLERLDPEPVHVLRRVQLVDRARPERRRLYTRIAELLNDEGEDVLDRAEWRTRELERPFDLEAVPGCELGKDDHGTGLDGDMVQSLFR